MPTKPVFIPAQRRRHGRGRPLAASPPPVLNQITGVAHGPAPEIIVVTVTGTLLALGELEG